MSDNRGCGCGKVFGFGCLALLILSVLGAVVIGFNFDSIRESELGQRVVGAANEAKESIEEMIAVSVEVAEAFPMDRCNVNLSTSRSGGVSEKTLELTLVNALVPEDLGEAAYALEVARFAAERYSGIDDVDSVKIEVARKVGAGVHFTHSESYRFTRDELLEPLPAEANAVSAAAAAAVEAGEEID